MGRARRSIERGRPGRRVLQPVGQRRVFRKPAHEGGALRHVRPAARRAAAVVVASLAPFHAVAQRATLGGKKKSAAHVAADAAAANADAAAAEEDRRSASILRARFVRVGFRDAVRTRGRARGDHRGGSRGVVRAVRRVGCGDVGLLVGGLARAADHGGTRGGIVAEVPSSPESYDEDTARELWDAAGEAGGAVGYASIEGGARDRRGSSQTVKRRSGSPK